LAHRSRAVVARPGEGFAEQLDAEVARDDKSVRVAELQGSTELLLVFGIVNPTRLPRVGRYLPQVSQDLRPADQLSGLRSMAGIFEPDNAAAGFVAARRNFHRALPGMVNPDAVNTFGRVLSVASKRCQSHGRDGHRTGGQITCIIQGMHEEATSVSELRSGSERHAPVMRTKCGTGGFRILTTFEDLMGTAGRDADGNIEIKVLQ
jgi:hypothetical protein